MQAFLKSLKDAKRWLYSCVKIEINREVRAACTCYLNHCIALSSSKVSSLSQWIPLPVCTVPVGPMCVANTWTMVCLKFTQRRQTQEELPRPNPLLPSCPLCPWSIGHNISDHISEDVPAQLLPITWILWLWIHLSSAKVDISCIIEALNIILGTSIMKILSFYATGRSNSEAYQILN